MDTYRASLLHLQPANPASATTPATTRPIVSDEFGPESSVTWAAGVKDLGGVGPAMRSSAAGVLVEDGVAVAMAVAVGVEVAGGVAIAGGGHAKTERHQDRMHASSERLVIAYGSADSPMR